MNKVFALYKKLFSLYGPQGWWPIVKNKKVVYHPYNYEIPVTKSQQFQIAVGAILTQNTNWKNAEKALLSLYNARLLNFFSLSKLSEEKIALLIRSSGYYNQKAKKIKNLLSVYPSLPKCNNVNEMRKILLGVKGIGPETADSSLLYAFKKPIFVVDSYTRRFCEKMGFGSFCDYENCRKFFEKNLPVDYAVYNEYHALIVKWGKLNNNLNNSSLK